MNVIKTLHPDGGKLFALLATLLATAPTALSAVPTVEVPVEAWRQRYHHVGPGAQDEATKVLVDAASDVIIAGNSGGDIVSLKYSGRDGSILWQSRSSGVAFAAALDGSGNLVVAGATSRDNGSYYTAKYAAADGALLWEKSGPSIGIAKSIAVDNSGNVAVTGSSWNGTNADYYTAKYAAMDGALVWERRHNGPANGFDDARAVATDASGNVIVTGSSSSTFYTAKYAATDGSLLWEKRYRDPASRGDGATAVVVDVNGNVVVTGESDNGANADYYTAKYAAADGMLLWERRYNGPANSTDYALAAAMDASGNVLVVGLSYNGINYDCYTAKYAAANGALLWEQRRQNGNVVPALAVDGDGNAVVTGYSDGEGYTVMYAAANGALLWEKRSVTSGFPGVAMDASGNVVVAGSSIGIPTGPDFMEANNDIYTAKYAAADGAIIWEARYDGIEEKQSVAKAVALDASGDVVVTGTSGGEFYTAKYAAAGGALRWEKRGPPGGAQAVALDSDGNVVITGFSSDYYTAKYAAADGALLWEQGDTHTLPYAMFDYGKESTVAVDQNGNVVIAGTTDLHSDRGATSAYLAKYSAADGALLWEHSLPGYMPAMTVDTEGNVVIAGTLLGPGTLALGLGGRSYWYTVKYAAADGAVVWERQHRIDHGREQAPRAVALDGSNNVIVAWTKLGDWASSLPATIYIARYAGLDGTQLWERHIDFDFFPGADAPALTLAVDPNGDVGAVVEWHSAYFYTAKHAGTSGAPLWEQYYARPSPLVGDNYSQTMAFDRNGNVVVTVFSWNGATSSVEQYAIKYSSVTGALLWEQHCGPADPQYYSTSTPRNLAIGPDGSVIVIGTSDGDYTTVKYAMTQVTYPTPVVLLLAVTSEGARLRFTGDAGRTYRLQRSSNPSGPWTTFAALVAQSDGAVEHLDPAPPASPAFYRVAAP